ncbi:Reverse transcriptase domain [Cinara cedri]|uniref:Reverse transcriptase domain n=1 Tax=Cinara cedri TaxID=506608 RepID=A0A5E4NT27_9HEMI|nr:Reverse transcriptase domain [Cinara cedri]
MDMHILFVDFIKAYDSIHRESLVNILKEFRFPSKIVNLIGASVNQTNIKVKIANTTSHPVRVTTGFRQGDALSSVFLNLVLEKIVQEMNVSEGIELGQSGKETSKGRGESRLTVNDDKTEYLIVSRSNRVYGLEQHIELEGHTFRKEYCLMSVEGCYTELHINVFCTSAWYHILREIELEQNYSYLEQPNHQLAIQPLNNFENLSENSDPSESDYLSSSIVAKAYSQSSCSQFSTFDYDY